MQLVREGRAANDVCTLELIHASDLEATVAIRWATLLNDKGLNEFSNGDSSEETGGMKGGLRRLSVHVAAHVTKPKEFKASGLGGISEDGADGNAPPTPEELKALQGRRESINGRRGSFSGRRGSVAGTPGIPAMGVLEEEDEAGYSGKASEVFSAGLPSLGKYKVLAKCTVREGKNGTATKLGEFEKDTVIDVVEEATNSTGLAVVRTVTALKNGALGGWVKLTTAKGKDLLEKQQGVRSGRRMSVSTRDSSGVVIVPAEELIDVTFDGQGALGMLFQEVQNTKSPMPDIIVKTLHPGSIAAGIKDVATGQILRAINGTDIGGKTYNVVMQMIGSTWRQHSHLVLTFVNPELVEDSEEEDGQPPENGGGKWIDGAAFASPNTTPHAAEAKAKGLAGPGTRSPRSGKTSPRYQGTTSWGDDVVETAVATLVYLGFPEEEAANALDGGDDVDGAIAKLAKTVPAKV